MGYHGLLQDSFTFTFLFNELRYTVENIVVKNIFKAVTQITLDSFLKPTSQ
jgi:hypothetical protein